MDLIDKIEAEVDRLELVILENHEMVEVHKAKELQRKLIGLYSKVIKAEADFSRLTESSKV